jgi:hypothetical protein
MDPVVATALATVDQIEFFVGITLKGDLGEDARFYQVQPETAHITWLIGHIALAMDRIGMAGLMGATALPDSLQPLFGTGIKPVPDPDAYPSWEETVGFLHQSLARLRARVSEMSRAELERPLPDGHPFAQRIATQGGLVTLLGLHTCYHLGQISLLRRAQGLPSGMAR